MKIKNTVSMRKETYITAYEAALILKIYFKETAFIEEKNFNIFGSEDAFLEIKPNKREAQLTYKPECNFVIKKIIERQAQSICKSGFLLESGERIGRGYTLIIIG
jgi:hypothetical protein